jgi:hypothetical protein
MEIGSSILASQRFLLDIKILPPVRSLPYLKMQMIAPNPCPKGYFFAPRLPILMITHVVAFDSFLRPQSWAAHAIPNSSAELYSTR